MDTKQIYFYNNCIRNIKYLDRVYCYYLQKEEKYIREIIFKLTLIIELNLVKKYYFWLLRNY